MLSNDELINILKDKIRSCESEVNDYCLELDTPEECERVQGKEEAYKEILNIILNSQCKSGLGF